MRVSSISNNTSFGHVFAVAGTGEQLNELKNIVRTSKGNGIFMEGTDLYVNRKGSGLCTEAARKGKEIAFVIAGKKDTDNVSFMHFGWGSRNGVSKHIGSFIDLEDVKKQARIIRKMMQK